MLVSTSYSVACISVAHSSIEPVTGTYTVWAINQISPTNGNIVFLVETGKWVVSWAVVELVTNLIATSFVLPDIVSRVFTDLCYPGILAFRLWLIHQRSSRIRTTRSQVYPILLIIIECGALYSVSLVAMLATYLSASNSAIVVIDMVHISTKRET